MKLLNTGITNIMYDVIQFLPGDQRIYENTTICYF